MPVASSDTRTWALIFPSQPSKALCPVAVLANSRCTDGRSGSRTATARVSAPTSIPQNNFFTWGWGYCSDEIAGLPRATICLLIDLLKHQDGLQQPSLSASKDSLFLLTLNMQAPKAFDSPQHKKRGTAADLRSRLRQGWPRVGTASPPKRENIFTPLNATYKGGM